MTARPWGGPSGLYPTAFEQAERQERQRCQAIIMSSEAEGREPLARHLALKTDMKAADAVAILKASPKAAAARRARLDGNVPVPDISAFEDEPGNRGDEAAEFASGAAAARQALGLSRAAGR